MFQKKHGRYHAVTGGMYLLWLLVGFAEFALPVDFAFKYICYDTVLGILGVVLTLLAAFEFKHKNVVNVASGTLDEHATVTHSEMIEHSFYQGLNLMQILYLHAIAWIRRSKFPLQQIGDSYIHEIEGSLIIRWVLLFLVTSPWLCRSMFPVNKFSDNYMKDNDKSTALIKFLYRIKKYQYVFYKHFVLHGLNISVALNNDPVVDQSYFRLFWLLLNASYVLEFFLQTLVKKKYMRQDTMLQMQKVLMTASSLAAFWVLRHVNIPIALVSLVMNFINRKHDVMNTMLIATLAIAYKYYIL
jgi:hypothetical protein